MVLYSPDWTNIGFSFINLTVNLFHYSTLIEQGLYLHILHFDSHRCPCLTVSFYVQAFRCLKSLVVHTEKLFFLFLNQNKSCGYSKEPSQWDGSFEHPKHMLKLIGKEIFYEILRSKICVYLTLWCIMHQHFEIHWKKKKKKLYTYFNQLYFHQYLPYVKQIISN